MIWENDKVWTVYVLDVHYKEFEHNLKIRRTTSISTSNTIGTVIANVTISSSRYQNVFLP